MSTNRTRHLIFATLAAGALKGHLLLIALHWALVSQAQWVAAGIPTLTFEMSGIYSDTINDRIYFCGESSLNGDFNVNDQTVSVQQEGQWSTLGSFLNRPKAALFHNDTLYVAGSFPSGNGLAIASLQCLVNGNWCECGTFDGSIYRLKTIDGDLYAIGAFTYADGQLCNGITKRTGGQWVPVGTFDVIGPPYIQDLVSWHGVLYATGTIRYGAPDPKDVAYLSPDGVWLALGPGILGGFGNGRSLAVYNDELYVSGGIPLNAGNAGHGIMRWDGQQFHPVGTGFQDQSNTYGNSVGASEMEVYDGKLWACGTFSYAGNVPCPGIAFWDGERWCGLPLGPEPEINTIEFFHDTLFASCHVNLNGEPVNCAVKFTGSIYSDTCSVAVGVPSLVSSAPQGLRAYRDAEGMLNILGLPPGTACMAEVFDAEGRSVHRRLGYSLGDRMQFQLPPLGPGAYIIRLGRHGAVRFLGP